MDNNFSKNFSCNFSFLNKNLNSSFKTNTVLNGLNSPFDLLFLDKILSLGKKVLYILPDEQSCLKIQKDLKNLLNVECEIFPAQEISPYSELDKNYYIYHEQIEILTKKPNIVLVTPKGLIEKFPGFEFYQKNKIEFKKEVSIDYTKIAQKLVSYGYKRTANVADIGEFALRGDILDIYSLSNYPVRIEFFADTIEDIRLFNPSSQKSFKSIENVEIYPLYKFILSEDNKNSFIKKIAKKPTEDEFIQKIKEELIEKVEQQGYFEGIEYYLNYFDIDKKASLLDYLNDYILVFKESSQILSKLENIDLTFKKEYSDGLKSNFKLELDSLNHFEQEEIKKLFKKFQSYSIDNFLSSDDFQADEIVEFDTDLPPKFSSVIEDISKYVKKYLNDGYKIYICTNFPNRLKEIFDELEIFSPSIFYYPSIAMGGAISKDDKISFDKILILSDKELFNQRSRDITTKKYYSNKQSGDFIDSINDIKIGEYVVHTVHGIGIYNGITKQTIDDTQKDYLEIQFLGTDKLFMPAEQINLLCRYRGSGAVKPKLSKMGGTTWENTKSKAKKELESIAYDLLDLYAKRKLARGIQFEEDSAWQYEMEENFEYTETPDQLKAIKETKHDMEEEKPMDRLICADVGYGKTEVAMRAMFKAVMSGYQTALIAPTTILTMQHYETIKERFEPFNVHTALLNRFCSKKEQNEIVKKINSGEIDVVIGTHRLLSSDINFKKLGLLVIDEEHKFGVRHKEKLKEFKENIDILSLSATPIPRTLNMALSGLKDLSVINTPPKNRLPIKTYVGEYSETYVKNAINQELQRDGQVYYLYNRVETIERFKKTLQDIVPNARIAVAHGQMNEKQLEDVIYKFAAKEFDVLLCTTIIESGLDIPNANTIIIHNSVNYGLAQLYQLRGRVGRCEKQAYCFCFYKKNKELNEQALKRLESIKEFSTLGSGYRIALRDIEIRGVGSILGTHQHGQMVSVGFDTYCNLLAECIEDIKQKRSKSPYSTETKKKNKQAIVDILADAYIPDDWAQTYEQKILEYKRISDVENLSELEDMELNFKDRFSKIPYCVENLIKLVKLRILATNIGITSIRQQGNMIRMNTPFTMQEWLYLKKRIDYKIVKYFSYSTPPKNLTDTKGILLMNKDEAEFSEIFNKLSDLFYHISKVIMDFKTN